MVTSCSGVVRLAGLAAFSAALNVAPTFSWTTATISTGKFVVVPVLANVRRRGMFLHEWLRAGEAGGGGGRPTQPPIAVLLCLSFIPCLQPAEPRMALRNDLGPFSSTTLCHPFPKPKNDSERDREREEREKKDGRQERGRDVRVRPIFKT